MDWYEICKFRHPKKYMTTLQLDRVLAMGLIDQAQYEEIINMS
jgi:hypothetical protein